MTIRYDLHCHTNRSRCSGMKPEVLLKVARKRGLDGISVNDHNTLEGAKAVMKLNKDRDFEVVPSIEVSSNFGDTLVYYATSEIRSRDFFEICDEARSQDALVVIAHPFRMLGLMRFRGNLEKASKHIDGIECFNARNLPIDDLLARNACNKLMLARTAGSDAHFPVEVGQGLTVFEGDLRKSIRARKTQAKGSRWKYPISSVYAGINKAQRILGLR